MGGDDDADVDLDWFFAADTLDFAFFEDAEEFGLHGEGHVANFVEEECASLGLLEFAGVAGGGAGERAFLVAEEFGLDELGGDSGAIQSDESVFVARRFFVDGAGYEFFAGARFAKDADAGLAGGDAVDLGEEPGHGRAGADEFVLAQAMAELSVFVLEAGELEGIFDGEEKLIGGEWLFEEIESA